MVRGLALQLSLLVGLALLPACGGPSEQTAATPVGAGQESAPQPDAESQRDAAPEAAAAAEAAPAPEGGKPVVVLSTSKGKIEIELDPERAPVTVENFLAYVDAGHYDGTVFHRVIPGFMIQGGGFTPEMSQKSTRAPIESEADNGLRNLRGALAMARTNDPNSATSQFFINLVDNVSLDPGARGTGYAVFGHVKSGLEVVDEIARVETATRGSHQNVPVEAVVIETARRKSTGS